MNQDSAEKHMYLLAACTDWVTRLLVPMVGGHHLHGRLQIQLEFFNNSSLSFGKRRFPMRMKSICINSFLFSIIDCSDNLLRKFV